MAAQAGHPEAVLVLDADRTLAAEDTGTLFWEAAARKWPDRGFEGLLKTLFKSSLGYSHNAFRQAALYHEEIAGEQDFDDICQLVVSAVHLRPEFVPLLPSRRPTRACQCGGDH